MKPLSVEITITIQDGYGSETRLVRKFYPKFLNTQQVNDVIKQEMSALAQDVEPLIPTTRAVSREQGAT